MNRNLIDFYKEKTLVRASYLPSFIFWSVGQTPGGLDKLRKLFSLALFNRFGQSGIDADRRLMLSRYPYSWARYAADGARMQFFDAQNRVIRKIALQQNDGQIEREFRLRSLMGDACPPVLAWDSQEGAIVERWLNIKRRGSDKAALSQAITLLKDKLYRCHSVDAEQYVSQFGDVIDQKKVRTFLTRYEVGRLEISDVHGDLWQGNLLYDRRGELVIVDWEYGRSCVVSHDIWTYLFQAQKAASKPFDARFFEKFAEAVSSLLDVRCDIETARAHHVIHLIERFSFFLSLNLPHKNEEIEYLRNEIGDMLEPNE
jgi:hypothetical protein